MEKNDVSLFLINRQACISELQFRDPGRFFFYPELGIAYAKIPRLSGLKIDNSIISYSQKMTTLLLIIAKYLRAGLRNVRTCSAEQGPHTLWVPIHMCAKIYEVKVTY